MFKRVVVGRLRVHLAPPQVLADGTIVLGAFPAEDDPGWGPWVDTFTQVVRVSKVPLAGANWSGTPGRPKLSKLRSR